MREHGVDENTIEQIRTDDRADFNSNSDFTIGQAISTIVNRLVFPLFDFTYG